MSCLFLYNPASGRGKRVEKRSAKIAAELKARFGVVDTAVSAAPKDLFAKAKAACGRYDVLVFAGGDGSFNEVLNGVCSAEGPAPVLGYIPTGTANDIARSCGIPRKLRRAVNNVKNGVAAGVDVMCVNGTHYAQYEISAGMFTPCSYSAPKGRKAALGRFAYVLEILAHDLKLADFEVTAEADGKVYRTNCEFALLLNGSSVGGMPVHSSAVLNDGKAELMLIRQVKKPRWYHKFRAFLKLIGFFIFGYKNAKSDDYIRICSDKFTVSVPEETVWNFDGERGVSGTVGIEVLKEKIRLIVPARKAAGIRFRKEGGAED